MSPNFNNENQSSVIKEIKETLASIPNGESFNINIFHINIKDIHVNVEQRAEGGGQINRNVGMNANQGGQNANNHSKTANVKSQFADGNGRSGIAGKNNDELGGQQGLKIRDSEIKKSIVKSESEQVAGIEEVRPEKPRLPKLKRPRRIG